MASGGGRRVVPPATNAGDARISPREAAARHAAAIAAGASAKGTGDATAVAPPKMMKHTQANSKYHADYHNHQQQKQVTQKQIKTQQKTPPQKHTHAQQNTRSTTTATTASSHANPKRGANKRNGDSNQGDSGDFISEVFALSEVAALGTLSAGTPRSPFHPKTTTTTQPPKPQQPHASPTPPQNQPQQPTLHSSTDNSSSSVITDDLMGRGVLCLATGTLHNSAADAHRKAADAAAAAQAEAAEISAVETSGAAAATTRTPESDRHRFRDRDGSSSNLIPAGIRAGVDPVSARFHAEQYLVTFCADSPVSELREGRRTLEIAMSQRDQQLRELVAKNLHRLMLSHDVTTQLSDLVLHGDGGEKAERVQHALQDAEQLASRLYASLLVQREHVARLRRVLELVARLKHVFEFPERIRSGKPLDPTRMETIIRQFHAVRAWLAAQRTPANAAPDRTTTAAGAAAGKSKVDTRIVARITSEVRHAVLTLQRELYYRAEKPGVSVDELGNTLELLMELQPEADHAHKLLSARQEKVLEAIRRIRGAAAADAILRRRLHPAQSSRRRGGAASQQTQPPPPPPPPALASSSVPLSSAQNVPVAPAAPLASVATAVGDDGGGGGAGGGGKKDVEGGGGDDEDAQFQDIEEAMEAVTVSIQKLTNAFVDGIGFLWQLARVVVGRVGGGGAAPSTEGDEDYDDPLRAEIAYERVTSMVSEVVNEYADAARMVLLPANTVMSREAALEVVHAGAALERLDIPPPCCGALSAVAREVTKEYCLSIVHSVRDVAIEFARSAPLDAVTLPEQLRVLVLEALRELRDVVAPGTPAAVLARDACIKAPVSAAREMHAAYFSALNIGGGGVCSASSTTAASNANVKQVEHYLIVASCIHGLAERVIPSVGPALSDALGGEGFAPVVNAAVGVIHGIERAVVEHFAHLMAAPLVCRVVRGVVAGGALHGSLVPPRAYACELVSELVLITARARAVARPRIAEQVLNLLKTAVGNAFRDSLLEMDEFQGVAMEQLLLELEFVEQILAPKSKTGFFLAAKRTLEAATRRSSAYDAILHTAVTMNALEQKALQAP